MKLLPVIVSIIAVFTADCRDLAGEPENRDSANNIKIYTDPNRTEEIVNTKRDMRRPVCKARNACVVMGGFCVTNATLCSGRLVADGCKETNCQCCVPGTLELNIQNIGVDLLSMKNSLNLTNEELKVELECISSNNTEANSYLKIMLQSMQANMTDGNSNMDLKMESVKSSVSNQDSELSSIKYAISNQDSELSTIKSGISNQTAELYSINSSISNQESELRSIKSAITNQETELNTIKSGLSNQASELNSIKSSISSQDSELNSIKSSISNQDSELNTIKSAISNQDSGINIIKSAISSQDSELSSIKSAISSQDSELNIIKSALSSQDADLNTLKAAIANQELKLNSMKEVPDYFYVSPQYYRLYMDVKRSWTEARDRCQAAGLRLAEPNDASARNLRKSLLDKFGSNTQAWVGAKGDGSTKFVFQKRGTYISKDSTYINNGRGATASTTNCLEVDALLSEYNSTPNSPYDVISCTYKHWTLCEVVKGLVY